MLAAREIISIRELEVIMVHPLRVESNVKDGLNKGYSHPGVNNFLIRIQKIDMAFTSKFVFVLGCFFLNEPRLQISLMVIL
jgi:hypothetical protein